MYDSSASQIAALIYLYTRRVLLNLNRNTELAQAVGVRLVHKCQLQGVILESTERKNLRTDAMYLHISNLELLCVRIRIFRRGHERLRLDFTPLFGSQSFVPRFLLLRLTFWLTASVKRQSENVAKP